MEWGDFGIPCRRHSIPGMGTDLPFLKKWSMTCRRTSFWTESYGALNAFAYLSTLLHHNTTQHTTITTTYNHLPNLRFGLDNFQEAMKIANRVAIEQIDWTKFKFMVFDIPSLHSSTYAERYEALGMWCVLCCVVLCCAVLCCVVLRCCLLTLCISRKSSWRQRIQIRQHRTLCKMCRHFALGKIFAGHHR